MYLYLKVELGRAFVADGAAGARRVAVALQETMVKLGHKQYRTLRKALETWASVDLRVRVSSLS